MKPGTVAVVGADSEPARIAAELSRGLRADKDATVFGYGVKTSPELCKDAMYVREDRPHALAHKPFDQPTHLDAQAVLFGSPEKRRRMTEFLERRTK